MRPLLAIAIAPALIVLSACSEAPRNFESDADIRHGEPDIARTLSIMESLDDVPLDDAIRTRVELYQSLFRQYADDPQTEFNRLAKMQAASTKNKRWTPQANESYEAYGDAVRASRVQRASLWPLNRAALDFQASPTDRSKLDAVGLRLRALFEVHPESQFIPSVQPDLVTIGDWPTNVPRDSFADSPASGNGG